MQIQCLWLWFPSTSRHHPIAAAAAIILISPQFARKRYAQQRRPVSQAASTAAAAARPRVSYHSRMISRTQTPSKWTAKTTTISNLRGGKGAMVRDKQQCAPPPITFGNNLQKSAQNGGPSSPYSRIIKNKNPLFFIPSNAQCAKGTEHVYSIHKVISARKTPQNIL